MSQSLSWLLASLAVCAAMALPALAQVQPATPPARGSMSVEWGLDGVSLGWSYLDVLLGPMNPDTNARNSRQAKGLPVGIGPSLDGSQAFFTAFYPPPPMPEMTNVPPPPPMPVDGAPVDPVVEAPPPPPVPEGLVIWLYNRGAHTTYVFFDKEGKVVSVAVLINKPGTTTNVQTAGGVSIGTGLASIINKIGYGAPSSMGTLNDYYFCVYDAQQVAYSIDRKSRKVVGITVGIPLAVLPQAASANPDGSLGTPGAPGGIIL